MVECHVDLLSSDDPDDIICAGTSLIEQVHFLTRYTVSAQQIMKPSKECDEQLSITMEQLKLKN